MKKNEDIYHLKKLKIKDKLHSNSKAKEKRRLQMIIRVWPILF